MDPASPMLSGAVSGDSMPSELLAAFVEVMLESSRTSHGNGDDNGTPESTAH